MHPKAAAGDFLGRFREIVSDPLNLLIHRHPSAGLVEDDYVYLHNGHRVPFAGPLAYYNNFSNILIINRGVHEPLEEYVFQELLQILPSAPTMLELGAYWGHYSMWLKKERPRASVYLVEPESSNLQAGVNNFKNHGYEGEFLQSFVGKGKFEVDEFLEAKKIPRLDVLHSDIQGYEGEMLEGAIKTLRKQAIDYIFVSTHSQALHHKISAGLRDHGYKIEVSSDLTETTSFDGFIFASSSQAKPLFSNFVPPSRTRIVESRPADLLEQLANTAKHRPL